MHLRVYIDALRLHFSLSSAIIRAAPVVSEAREVRSTTWRFASLVAL